MMYTTMSYIPSFNPRTTFSIVLDDDDDAILQQNPV